ncbi:hypothetical protein DXG03_004110 [Asterophora parasitica]|uniref:Asl1-like glycosyl hydrolase catalytic domain-containing protein n=1 Tax=Asterophora parasitica TaxID=117018 RepID=A0A9P7KBJ3_9AGAR|nr:hypothetical protein DXG03_004110 [Asterophora parasitica]
MLWGLKSVEQFSANWRSNRARGDVKAVLGMNEPQQKGQADMTPEDGAIVWKTYLEPLRAQGIRLGSPAPSSAPSGKTWLVDFFAACAESCTVDFIALHWYGTNAAQFISYVQDMHATFAERPVWVTEWACHNFNPASPNPRQCTAEEVTAFLNETQQWMDETEWVERYAWFGAMREDAMNDVNPDNALMDKEGKLNSLGRQYIGAADGVVYGNGGRSPRWDVHAVSLLILLFVSVMAYFV